MFFLNSILFLFRFLILAFLIIVSIVVTEKYYKTNEIIVFYTNIVIILFFTIFYLFIFSASMHIYGDSKTVLYVYLLNNHPYSFAFGYSQLFLILASLFKFDIYFLFLFINLFILPVLIYISTYFFFKIFMNSQLFAHKSAFMFGCSEVIFSGFVTNSKEDFGILFIILSLYFFYSLKNHNFKIDYRFVLSSIKLFSLITKKISI